MICSNVTCTVDTPPDYSSPAAGPSEGLGGASCTSNAVCYVVGSYGVGSSGDSRTLVLALTGTTWSRVTSASLGAGYTSSLRSISCVAGACMAAGTGVGHRRQLGLIERNF
jgi:hypothetical protein